MAKRFAAKISSRSDQLNQICIHQDSAINCMDRPQLDLQEARSEAWIKSPIIAKFRMQNLQAIDAGGIKLQRQAHGQGIDRFSSDRSSQVAEAHPNPAQAIGLRPKFSHPTQSTGDQLGQTGNAICAGHGELVPTAIPHQLELETAVGR
jgi:hypothetical protein